MPIMKQPLDDALWVSAYRPVSFLFMQVGNIQNVIVDIYFDGVKFATIVKPVFAEALIILPFKFLAIDIQEYAQEYLSPHMGIRSAAAPNTVDTDANTVSTKRYDNIKHYAKCFIRARYEQYDQVTGLVKPVAGVLEQSAEFMICNATLQHYESFDITLAPTQNLKPFYRNSSALIKFLTNKKGDILCKQGTPQTLSLIAYNTHAYSVTTFDAQGQQIATGLAGLVPTSGSMFNQNYHARIGVGDININTINNWIGIVPNPVPVINNTVAYWQIQAVYVIPVLGYLFPVPVSEVATFRYDKCASSFQLDYMNPLGGFDSYVFSAASVTSRIGKKSSTVQRSLSKGGYSPSTWGTSEVGSRQLSVELNDVFEVSVTSVTIEQMKQLKELIASPEVYWQQNGISVPVNIVDQDQQAGGWDKLTSKFKFNFQLANDRIIQRF